ncbi:MAG: hypothetical protein WDN28_18265 [Chthoniobacter sp.]
MSETMQYWASIFFVQSARETPHFAESLAAEVDVYVVTPGAQLWHRIRPIEEQRVDPQGRDETRIARKALLPHRALEVVEG